MTSRKELLLLTLSLLICVLPTWYWFRVDQAYPQNDAAFYMMFAQDMYKSFEYEGFLSGMRELFMHRGWKPIIFPSVVVPFFMIAGGNVLLTQQIFCLFILSVLIILIYKFARKWLSPADSFLLTIATGSTTTIFHSSISLMTELPFCIVLLFILMRFLKLDVKDFRSFILLALPLSFAFLLRPVETLLYILPLAFFYIGRLIRERTISLRFICLEIISIAVLGLFLTAPGWNKGLSLPFNFISASIILAPQLLLIFISRKNLIASNLAKTIAIIFSAILIWYGNFVDFLWSWIYETTFGEMARLTGGRVNRSLLESLEFIFWYHGNILLYSFLLVTLVVLIITKFHYLRRNKQTSFSLILMFFTPLILGFMTKNGSALYYVSGFVLLYILGFIILLETKKSLKILTVTLLMVFTSIQYLSHYFFINGTYDPFQYAVSHYYPPPVDKELTNEILHELHKWESFNKPGTILFNLQTKRKWAAANPFSLTLIENEKFIQTKLLTPGPTYPAPALENFINIVSKENSVMLLGPLESDPDHEGHDQGQSIVQYFYELYTNDQLKKNGFSEIHRFSLKRTDPWGEEETLSYIVIEKLK